MNRELPSILPIVVILAAFIVGYMLPLTADVRVAYVFGWVVGVLSLIAAGWWGR